MCFAGNTLIPLADGREHRLTDLADGQEHVVYSCSESGRVSFARCTVVPSRRTPARRRVSFDNCAAVTCAPHATLQLRDGKCAQVDDLRLGASLMPLYTSRDRDGYVLVQQNYSGRMQRAHWIVARSGLLGPIPKFEGQRTVIHHKNFAQADNRPENLEYMGDRDHSAFHRSLVERNTHWQSPAFEEQRVAALARKAATLEGHAYFAQRGTRNIVAYMLARRDEFQRAVAGNGKRGANVLRAYNQSERGKAKSRELANALYTCERCGERVKSYIGLHNHRRWRHGYNHQVGAVARPRGSRPRLFCVRVQGARTFALSAGVFAGACEPDSGDR